MAGPQQAPLVSVVIPAYNAAEFLDATLRSVLAQDWPALEVVVVDDGSTDATPEVLRRFGERIEVVRIANSGGPSRPRNVGIRRARGEFIALFDGDDLMHEGKITRTMAAFALGAEVGAAFTGFRSIDLEDRVLKPDYLAEYTSFRPYLEASALENVWLIEGRDMFRCLILANFVGTSSVICRRGVFERVGFFDESLENGDDKEMWFRIARDGYRLAFVDEILHSYRINPGGVSARGAKRMPAVIEVMQRQWAHCQSDDERAELRRQLRRLRYSEAWALRQQGDLAGAAASYRESLKLGWNPRAALGLLRTRLMAFAKRD